MGLEFPGSFPLPFLCISVTLADFQSTGIIPVSAELLNLNMYRWGGGRKRILKSSQYSWVEEIGSSGFVDVKAL